MYQQIIDKVIQQSTTDFEEFGVEHATLAEMGQVCGNSLLSRMHARSLSQQQPSHSPRHFLSSFSSLHLLPFIYFLFIFFLRAFGTREESHTEGSLGGLGCGEAGGKRGGRSIRAGLRAHSLAQSLGGSSVFGSLFIAQTTARALAKPPPHLPLPV